MTANLFEVIKKVNELPGGKLHAYFADNIQNVHREVGKTGWGSIKMAITASDAGKILDAIMGNPSEMSVMLFVVDRQSIDEVKNQMELESSHD